MFGILQRQVTRNRHKTELYLQRLNGTDRMPYMYQILFQWSRNARIPTFQYLGHAIINPSHAEMVQDGELQWITNAIYRMVSFQVTSQSHDIVQRQITKKMFRDTGMVVTMAV